MMFFCTRCLISLFLVCLSNVALASSCQKNISNFQIEKKPSIEEGFHVSTKAQIVINKNPGDVKAWFDNVAPEKIIHSTDKVSGIAGTKLVGSKVWGSINSTRLVCYEDSNTSLEQIILNIPGKIFKYQMWDFSRDITHAIKYAISDFTVKPIGKNQSLLVWNFAFRPSSYVVRLPLKHYVENDFQEYMEKGLTSIKVLLES